MSLYQLGGRLELARTTGLDLLKPARAAAPAASSRRPPGLPGRGAPVALGRLALSALRLSGAGGGGAVASKMRDVFRYTPARGDAGTAVGGSDSTAATAAATPAACSKKGPTVGGQGSGEGRDTKGELWESGADSGVDFCSNHSVSACVNILRPALVFLL
jgi:hypothetical protein